jgi:hypothetical protein
MYVCMYVCMHVCIYLCTHVYVYMFAGIYERMYFSMCTCMDACGHVYRVFMYVYVCMHVCANVESHAETYASFADMALRMHMLACVNEDAHAHFLKRRCPRTFLETKMPTHISRFTVRIPAYFPVPQIHMAYTNVCSGRI